MSRGSYPLMLTMALSAPGAANALGLGDIHIDSKLNQPLSAHIDILGATEQELASLRAAVASRELFQQFGSDRPSFLSSAQFQVTRDRQRRPVLSVHSSEPFTEPLVSFLIDLRWPNGNLVREYTLLLDPATPSDKSEFTAIKIAVPESVITAVPFALTPVAAVSSDIAEPAAEPVKAAENPTSSDTNVPAAPAPAKRRISVKAQPAVKAQRTTSSASFSNEAPASYTVRPNETLHGIARMTGAQSAADVRQMMIALFRANPDAFDGNINRLHRGAVLVMPTAEQLAAVSKSEANREFRAQMSAWRLAGRPVAPTVVAAEPPAAPKPEPVVATADAAPAVVSNVADEELKQRIQVLERSLREVKSSIERDDAKLRDLQAEAETAAAMTPAVSAPVAAHRSMPPAKRFVQGAGILGSALGLFWLLHVRRRPPGSKVPAAQEAPVSEIVDQPFASVEPMAKPMPMAPAIVAAALVQEFAEEETVILDTAGDTTMHVAMDPTVEFKRDENLEDLERTAQHVYMPSDLHDQSIPFVERRTNVVDVLRAAINREPHRRELKLKLLELYYATAAANQNSFLEVAKMLARDRGVLATGDWDRVVAMGRAIAPGDKLFLLDPDAGTELSDVADSAA